MGFMHINNLYRDQDIQMFKECYVLEKIHGTSAHIRFHRHENHPEYSVSFFSGGAQHSTFVALFDEAKLLELFNTHLLARAGGEDLIVYGEAYGGSMQKMSDTYGKQLKFVAFDVKVGDCWLNVEAAESAIKALELEFVWYTKSSTAIEELNQWRDQDSQQAIRNGCGEGKMAEGVIIRPLIELTKNNGDRIIVKHKRDDFRETSTPRVVGEKLVVLTEANKIADEWVVQERLEHVLSKLNLPDMDTRHIPVVIKAMVEDVKREGELEIKWSKDVEKAVGTRTAVLYKGFCQLQLVER